VVSNAVDVLRSALIVAIAAGCTAETLELDERDAGAVRPRDAGDIGPRRDGGFSRDAGPRPAADHWTLEPKEAQVVVVDTFTELVTAWARVEIYPSDVCDHGGPVEVELTARGFMIRAFSWVRHPVRPEEDCPPIADQVIRHVALPETPPGVYEVFEPISGSSAELRIEAAPSVECNTPGNTCVADCQCSADDACIPGTNLCARPCTAVVSGCCGEIHPDRDLECEPTMACVGSFEWTAVGRCAPHDDDGCEGRPCPPGMICPPSGVATSCIWSVELSGAVRHPCTSSSECAAGLVCVQHENARRCEIPCFTNDMRCPRMHACDAAAGWVCEWLGE
jgi:hypothetical protein